MDYAALYFCRRINCANGIDKSGQTVNRGNKDIFRSSVPDFVQDADPVFCTFIAANPKSKDLTVTIQTSSNGNIDGFLYNLSILSNMKRKYKVTVLFVLI